MEFTDAYKESGPLAWSPDGTLLAVLSGNRLTVRDTSTLMIVNLFSNVDVVNRLEWSRDGKYVLCAMYKRGMVQVWDVENPEWNCKIVEGPAGLAHSRWSPDGRCILNTNDFNVRITVWSICSSAGVTASLRTPKFADRAADFSSDGKFLAIAERKDGKDYIQIYQCSSWSPVNRFPVETKDLADLKWSPDDSSIGVWDSILEYLFLAYSPDGRRLGRYQAYEGSLGIKSVRWAPSSQFLAIGSFDHKARIINQLTWRPIDDYSHPPSLRPAHHVTIYRERDVTGAVSEMITGDFGGAAVDRSVYDVGLPGDEVSLTVVKSPPDRPNPKIGIGLLEWSCDSGLMMTRNDSSPNALWVWVTRDLALTSILIQLAPIRAARWDPRRGRLAVCTGGRMIFLWTPSGASCVQVPLQGFNVMNIEWNSTGDALVLQDRDSYCLAFVGC